MTTNIDKFLNLVTFLKTKNINPFCTSFIENRHEGNALCTGFECNNCVFDSLESTKKFEEELLELNKLSKTVNLIHPKRE